MNWPKTTLAIAAMTFAAAVAAAQEPGAPAPRFKNLKVLPRDVPSEQLVSTMKSFTRALDVRCTHCHIGEEGKPLSTYDFASDKKPNKLIARDMMRLVNRLNTKDLPAIGGLLDPKVTCYTCHRGAKEPATVAPPRQS